MDKLKAIAIFVEIADQGSMSAAARSLGVVNSVVSKNLNELESWLGRKLVFRSTRNLRLTQDGVTYLEQCRRILDDVAWLEASTKKQDQIVSGHEVARIGARSGDHRVDYTNAAAVEALCGQLLYYL